METLMSVVSEALEGRDQELNDWYSLVHVRDVMRLPGSIAVQRFARAAIQPMSTGHEGDRAWSYLALYEIADKEACSRGHRDDLATERMPISESFDVTAFHEAYYDPVDGIAAQDFSGPCGNRAVLHVGLRAGENGGARLEAMFRGGLMASVRALPGIADASLFRHGTGQWLRLPPVYSHIMVCHCDDLSLAIAGWDEFVRVGDVGGNESAFSNAHVAAYTPLMQRLRAEAVLSASDEMVAMEARARAALRNSGRRD